MKKSVPAEMEKPADLVECEGNLSAGQFQQLAEIARVDLDSDASTLLTLAADELARAEFSVLRAGAYFLKLREITSIERQRTDCRTALSGGGFEAALLTSGINPRTARRAMQVASYVASLPADKAKRMAGLPKMKILPLIKADPVMVDQLLDEGALDGEDALSVRELRDRLSKSEKRANTAEQMLQVERNNLAAEKLKSTMEVFDVGLSYHAGAARQEVVLQAQVIRTATELLGVSLRDHLFFAPNDDGFEEDVIRQHRERAAGTAFHLLTDLNVGIGDLLRKLADHFGFSATHGLDPEFCLDDKEIKRVSDARKRIIGDLKQAASKREDAREDARPGKRGRKRD